MHLNLTRISLTRRVAAAAVLVLLVAGSVLAASPLQLGQASGRAFSSARIASPEATEPADASEAQERSEAPESPEANDAPDAVDAPGALPSASEVARILANLKAAGISVTADAFNALVAKVGVGGAVRSLLFAKASGKTPDQIVAMFQSGLGWGALAHNLKLSIGPGIGSIMSGGHGKPGKSR